MKHLLTKSSVKRLLACVLTGVLFLAAPFGIAASKIKQNLNRASFKIEALANGCKKVTDGAGRTLILVPRGRKLPSGFTKNATIIPIPVRRVLFTSPTQVCLLRALNSGTVWESIIGVTIPNRDWYIAPVKKGLRQGRIGFVGDGYKPDFERIRALAPDLVFTYSGPAGLNGLNTKLQELQIPYAVDNEYLEADPLARMEWLRFIAAFYDQDQLAQNYLNRMITRIAKLQKDCRSAVRPRIAWGVIYQGKMYVPAAGSYAAKMITLAGGDYLFSDRIQGTGGVNISIEEFYRTAKAADILIYSSFPKVTPNTARILEAAPVLAELKAIRQGRVWCLQPWFYQSLDRTDEILFDLAAIFHPRGARPERLEYFYKLP